MLEEYQNKLQEWRKSHPISEGDFENWKSSLVTQRLFTDLKEIFIDSLDYIAGSNESELAQNAMRFRECKDNIETILNWKPQELINED